MIDNKDDKNKPTFSTFDDNIPVDSASEKFQFPDEQIKDEENSIKNKRVFKLPLIIMMALLLIFIIAFRGVILEAFGFFRGYEEQVFEAHGMRIVEGQEYVLVFEFDEFMSTIEMAPTGRVVAEMDGQRWVLQDPLILTDLDEAVGLFRAVEYLKLPTYLPAGFEFIEARFRVCPISNPDEEFVGTSLLIVYSNGVESFEYEVVVHISPSFNLYEWSYESEDPLYAMEVMTPCEYSEYGEWIIEADDAPEIVHLYGEIPMEVVYREEVILANGQIAWLSEYDLQVFISTESFVTYTFFFGPSRRRVGANLDRYTIIRMAESLEYIAPM